MGAAVSASFHFLRPEWLLALLPALLLAVLCWRRLGAGNNPWAGLVDPHLLRHLALAETAPRRRWPALVLLAGLTLATLAMAGPAWEKLPSPTLEARDPTVVVLSLAQSMNAKDRSPTRLGAARHKVDDILKRMQGAQVGLVIYADIPFVASPLTEDARVVGQMLPELATDLMPVLDERPDLAIAKAVELLKGAGAPSGRIILVTDSPGDAPERTEAAAAAAAGAGYPVSVIGVGTAAGSPLLTFAGTPIRARDGTELLARMDTAALARLATAGGGAFAEISADGRDLDRVLAGGMALSGAGLIEQAGLTVDQWADMGPFLLLLVVLAAPLAFRRGWIAIALLGALPATSVLTRSAAAAEAPDTWQNLWRTPDQQGADAFGRDDFAAAAGRFADQAWKAGALYRAGNYEAAAAAYGGIRGADYNRGNALARAGRLEDALAAYDAALAADPEHFDAFHNRELVRKLLEQKKNEEEKKKGGGGQGKDGQGQDGKGKDGQGKDGQGRPDVGNPNPGKPDPAKNDPAKNDPAKNEPAKNEPAKGDQSKNEPPKSEPPKNDPAKNEPPKGDPAKSDPAKPAAQKPDDKAPDPKTGDAGKDPAPPKPPAPPPQQKPPAPPPPPQAAPREPAPPDLQPPPDGSADRIAPRAKAEADQTREQMLRMVPDDPSGLLRARIRSHYENRALAGDGRAAPGAVP